jgi:hypothetical protein
LSHVYSNIDQQRRAMEICKLGVGVGVGTRHILAAGNNGLVCKIGTMYVRCITLLHDWYCIPTVKVYCKALVLSFYRHLLWKLMFHFNV